MYILYFVVLMVISCVIFNPESTTSENMEDELEDEKFVAEDEMWDLENLVRDMRLSVTQSTGTLIRAGYKRFIF